jgi:hypothetical protein
MSFAHIELPLDAAARLIIQFAIAKEVVDPLPLCGNELAFDFVVKLTVPFGSALAGTAIGYMSQTVLVLGACRFYYIWREVGFCRKLVESFNGGHHPF